MHTLGHKSTDFSFHISVIAKTVLLAQGQRNICKFLQRKCKEWVQRSRHHI